MNVSLRAIAERAGCSRATVSYALNHSKQVSAATRERVHVIAREMGWIPNPELARQMQITRRTRSDFSLPPLGIVSCLPEQKNSGQGSIVALTEGAIDYAERLGFTVNFLNVSVEGISPNRMKSILTSRGVEGLVFMGTVLPEIPREYLEAAQGFAVSIAGHSNASLPYHGALPDLLAAGEMAIKNIHAHGYRRVASLITESVDSPLRWGFEAGVTMGLKESGFGDTLPVMRMGITDDSYDALEDTIFDMRPDSLLGLDYHRSLRLQQRLRAKGLDIPLFALDYFPEHQVEGGIDLMHRRVGRAAVELVVNQLNTAETGVPEIQLSLNVEGVWRDHPTAASVVKKGKAKKQRPRT